MVANMWKNNLKNVESNNNESLYETLFDFVLQRNGTYVLSESVKPARFATYESYNYNSSV